MSHSSALGGVGPFAAGRVDPGERFEGGLGPERARLPIAGDRLLPLALSLPEARRALPARALLASLTGLRVDAPLLLPERREPGVLRRIASRSSAKRSSDRDAASSLAVLLEELLEDADRARRSASGSEQTKAASRRSSRRRARSKGKRLQR